MAAHHHIGWNRLEHSLTTIKPGDRVSVDTLVSETGLLPETIETVLNALTKTELFQRSEGNVFVRRRLLLSIASPAEPPRPSPAV